jgi:hypothetical protein
VLPLTPFLPAWRRRLWLLPVAAAAMAACFLPATVRATNFYINASGALGNGSGSSAANSASATPGNYNSIVSSQSAAGTTIVYAPGTYYVYPALPMYSGVVHQGSGIDSTFIKMANGAASGTFTPMFLAQNSTAAAVSNFKFTDATFDFNSNNTAWWSQGTGTSIAFAFSLADHCTIQRIKFINIGAKNEEAFPIFLSATSTWRITRSI